MTRRRARAFALAAALGGAFATSPAFAQSGEELFKECSSGHSVKVGENDVGPSLHGLVGRQIATAEGFRYSNIFKAQKFVWTEDLLDRFLADPQAMFRGSKMPYAGMPDAAQRAALIGWLKEATK